jgi:hypothetical protein
VASIGPTRNCLGGGIVSGDGKANSELVRLSRCEVQRRRSLKQRYYAIIGSEQICG